MKETENTPSPELTSESTATPIKSIKGVTYHEEVLTKLQEYLVFAMGYNDQI